MEFKFGISIAIGWNQVVFKRYSKFLYTNFELILNMFLMLDYNMNLKLIQSEV